MPLGGVGEIGMNFALYGYGESNNRRWIIVDIGVTFAGDNLPGINLILPNIDYALSTGTIDAIVITHAHEDHYGGLLSLWPQIKAPIFCTSFTASLLESKQASNGTSLSLPITQFKAGDKFQAGSFEVEAIHVCHSIPEPVSLLLRSPLGNVIHTGDWKLDKSPVLGPPLDIEHFKRVGDEGILALICDSTNAMRDGTSPGEGDVATSLQNFISKAKGRVIISSFSSHVGRLRSVALAAQANGRKVMLLGRSLQQVASVARDLGYLDDLPPFAPESDYATTPRDQLIIMCTGSQGEPRAALNRLSLDNHPIAKLSSGDMVIFSSRTIPGNERSVIDIQNRLVSRGIDIVLDGEHGLTHISGHPRRDELRQMYSWTRPQIGIPVHGEARHLAAHARLMSDENIPDVCPIFNGELVRLAPGPAEVLTSVETGRLYQDGHFVGSPDQTGISARKSLSNNGYIAVHAVLDKQGNFIKPLELSVRGIPNIVFGEDNLTDILYDTVEDTLMSIPPKRFNDEDRIMKSIRKAVQSQCKKLWGKKPITDVFVAIVT